MGISSFSGQAFHERLVDEGKEAEGAAPSAASLGAFYKTMAYALLSGFGAFMFGYTMGFTSSTLPAMFGQNSRNVFVPGHCEDSHVSSYMGSLFSSIVNVGAMLGSITTGSLADVVGRPRAITVAGIPLLSGYIMLALSRVPVQAIISRAVAGVGVGMSSVIVPMYISEISPNAYRGWLGTMNQLMIATGVFFVNFVAVVVPHEETTYQGCDDDSKTTTIGANWVTLAWVGVAVSAAMIVTSLVLVESPAYLLGREDRDGAVQVMRKLWEPGCHLDDYLADYDKDDKETEEVGGGYRALCAPETRTPLIIGSILMIFQQWSGFNAVVFYGGSIFKMAGIKEADQAQLYLKTTQVVFNFVSLYLMDRAGRRTLMLAASGGMLFSLAVVGILFLLLSQGHFKEGWLMIVVLMGYVISFSIGMGPVTWLMVSELFPPHTRPLAMSIATMVNWMSAFVVTYTFSLMTVALKNFGTFWFYAGVCLVALLFTLYILPETKGLSNTQIKAVLARVRFCGGCLSSRRLSSAHPDDERTPRQDGSVAMSPLSRGDRSESMS